MFTGALRPWNVESLQFADVVVLASGLGLHDLLNHHGRTEIGLAQLGERLVARPRIHDPALPRRSDSGEKCRPFLGGRLVAAAACLRRPDARIVGGRVELPDDRHLRPVSVVGGCLPQGEQPRTQLVHHRLIGAGEFLGEAVAGTGPQRNRLVQVKQGVAVVLAHQPTGISSESTGKDAFMSERSVSVGPTLPGRPAAASAWRLNARAAPRSTCCTVAVRCPTVSGQSSCQRVPSVIQRSSAVSTSWRMRASEANMLALTAKPRAAYSVFAERICQSRLAT